jgi:hypothetical protein
VAALIYAAVGLLLLSQFGGQALNYLRSTGWQQVEGEVVFSGVEDVWDTTGDRFEPQVVYTYDVDGVTYESTQIDLRDATYMGNQDDALEIANQYPVGETVTPYVNPSDPTRAVLNRDLPGAVLVIVGTGLVLLLLSAGLSVRLLTNRQNK